MAKHKRSKKRPQPKHKKQSKSQHDKRKRLQRPNPNRKKTTNAKVPLTGAMQTAAAVLQAVMDPRIGFRLAIIVTGMFLADGRRTASAWFAAAGVQDDWDRFYDCLISVGRTSVKLATAVLGLVVRKLAPGLGSCSRSARWVSRRRCGWSSMVLMRRGRFSCPYLRWASSSSAACEKTPVCLTCLLRVLTATASMARTESVWQSVPGTAKAGARSLTIVAGSK
jgi:hypothetical protein